jgi:hypothetical protein
MGDINNRKASVSIGSAMCYIGKTRHEVSYVVPVSFKSGNRPVPVSSRSELQRTSYFQLVPDMSQSVPVSPHGEFREEQNEERVHKDVSSNCQC